MRRSTFRLFSLFLALVLLTFNTTFSKAQGRYTASYQDFYDGLAPYGQWIEDPQYGYVWLPDVADDFRPYYTNGYWVNTQYGNTWVSDYDWGWAPFHYGRWTYDSYYGWLWIPDTEWAPAWVSWRSSGSYYGWAPMGPGININVNLGRIPVDWWVFITPGYFYDRSFYRYCNNDYNFRRNIYSRTTIINYTYVDNRTTYYTGPRADDYYQHTGRRPSMFNIDNNNRRGATRVKGDRISVYRPEIRKTAGANPSRVVNTDRAISRRPQAFNGTAANATGRNTVLRGNAANAVSAPGRTQRLNDAPASRQGTAIQEQGNRQVRQQNTQWQQPGQNNVAVPPQQRQNTLPGQQRNLQAQPQRNVQVEQQQQRAAQMQQRNAQLEQQRSMQMQQREAQVQQRNAQMEQQRAQQAQQRDMQLQQQRNVQMQQREAQMQQRNAQMEQQRAQQAQQRDMQLQQQRNLQMQQREAQMQQRNAQIEQQRAQQAQQRDMQLQQQRNVQMQQRNTQMEQQRAQQAQQRDMQLQQQRSMQMEQQQARPAQRQQESPMRMHRDGSR